MTMPPVNIDELNEIMDNDVQLIQECFAEFLMSYSVLIADLNAAVTSLDFDEIDNIAHKFKGTLRYLAAKPAARAAQEIETAGQNQDAEHLDEKISALEAECKKLILYIDELSS